MAFIPLDPGEYTFVVTATNADGSTSSQRGAPVVSATARPRRWPGCFDGNAATSERVDSADPSELAVRVSQARFGNPGTRQDERGHAHPARPTLPA